MMNGVKVQQIIEESLPSENGKLTRALRVTFTVNDQGPFIERFPRDGTTGEMINLALDTFARELKKVLG